ncbi:MAG: hypothetical protein HY264_02045 [Chloroflexi bacterium]|nr:hypothetical protein [Chloroflexota bacterium]
MARSRVRSRLALLAVFTSTALATLIAGPVHASDNITPDGFHDNTGSLIGYDGAATCFAAGWAIDPDLESARVTVQILSDGVPVWTGPADQYREDLLSYPSDGYHGFFVELDGLIRPDVPHVITVRAEDVNVPGLWVDLGQLTPPTLTCTSMWGSLDTTSSVMTRSACLIEGWAADLDTPTGPRAEVRISIDGVVAAETTADLYRDDVRLAGFGDGYSGWSVNLFGKLSSNRPHHVTAEERDTTAKRIWVPLEPQTGIDVTCIAQRGPGG